MIYLELSIAAIKCYFKIFTKEKIKGTILAMTHTCQAIQQVWFSTYSRKTKRGQEDKIPLPGERHRQRNCKYLRNSKYSLRCVKFKKVIINKFRTTNVQPTVTYFPLWNMHNCGFRVILWARHTMFTKKASNRTKTDDAISSRVTLPDENKKLH